TGAPTRAFPSPTSRRCAMRSRTPRSRARSCCTTVPRTASTRTTGRATAKSRPGTDGSACSPGSRRTAWPSLPSHAVEAARPPPADVVGDGDGGGQGDLRRIVDAGGRARHHLPDLVAREPARFGQFLGGDGDLVGQGLGQEPDHEAGGKWPRLRGQVAHAP